MAVTVMKKIIIISILGIVFVLSGCETVKNDANLTTDALVTATEEKRSEYSEITESPKISETVTNSDISSSSNTKTESKSNNEAESNPKSSIAGKIIAVDAGHGINSYNKQESIAPNSSEKKAAFASGTSGKNQTEEELNLAVALKLQKALENKGAIVHMTRTTHNSDMTNIDRAEFANKLNADISVKIHADGNNSSSVHGVSVLVPGTQYISDSNVINKSRTAGEYILSEFVKSTGANNRGISVRNDLTGFNWTKVPIVLVEMGFMTNPEEDKLMETDDYQDKMVNGMVSGLELYFSNGV